MKYDMKVCKCDLGIWANTKKKIAFVGFLKIVLELCMWEGLKFDYAKLYVTKRYNFFSKNVQFCATVHCWKLKI